jgi:hypothetical protein
MELYVALPATRCRVASRARVYTGGADLVRAQPSPRARPRAPAPARTHESAHTGPPASHTQTAPHIPNSNQQHAASQWPDQMRAIHQSCVPDNRRQTRRTYYRIARTPVLHARAPLHDMGRGGSAGRGRVTQRGVTARGVSRATGRHAGGKGGRSNVDGITRRYARGDFAYPHASGKDRAEPHQHPSKSEGTWGLVSACV